MQEHYYKSVAESLQEHMLEGEDKLLPLVGNLDEVNEEQSSPSAGSWIDDSSDNETIDSSDLFEGDSEVKNQE